MKWHSLSLKKVFEELNSSEKGLSKKEAEKRLREIGENKLVRTKKISPIKIFLNQFKSFLVLLLVFAVIVSLGLSIFFEAEYFVDAVLILIILLANALFGFFQDFKAEKSIEALQKLSEQFTRVIRNGREKEVSVVELVPGDIILLEEGNVVPADARIIECHDAAVNESALTGESIPVSKQTGEIEDDAILPEKKNLLFMNTAVVRGNVKAIVFGTAMQTEMGKIATELQNVEERETPFEIEINRLGKKIAIGIIALVAFIAVIQFILQTTGLVELFLLSISLMVAAVPEGLPAVVTLALALGVRKMVKRRALVRRLSTVESLGSVDVICSDKTGTMTENKMRVRDLFAFGEKGKKLMLRTGLLCNNVHEIDGELKGDPTERALVRSALKNGFAFGEKKEKNLLKEIAFSSERKMMSVVYKEKGKMLLYSKGAPEILLEKCAFFFEEGKRKKLTPEKRKEILQKNNAFAENALRVLGFAFKEVKEKGIENEKLLERDLVFLGLQGMIDPPREEVKHAIKDCRNAGIAVKMITGDNALTAKAIGKELGFAGKVLLGKDIEKMSLEKLQEKVEETDIFARVNPLHKLKIIEALHKNKHVVAMTGDGVNDAPALKNADIGISMGVRGTDVAKQASDMVLLNDNFATIKDAVEEGRGIFDNIRKFVNYLLSANVAEVLIVFLASVFGFGLVLSAVHLLWINLLTDGLPALALGVDPLAKNIMKRKPRAKKEGVINKEMIYSIVGIGVLMTVIIFGMIFLSFDGVNSLIKIQTIVFTSLVVFEIARLSLIKVQYNSKLFSNKWLWLAGASSLGLQLLVLYTPLNVFFKVIPLGLQEWSLILGGLVVFLVSGFIAVKAIGRKTLS